MPSAPSHAPESLLTQERRAAPANDNASAVLQCYLRDVHRFPVLSQARERVLGQVLRLVVRVAGALRSTGVPLSDLIQEANIGLMRAVDGFDYRRNLKFSTYAV